MNSTVQNFFRAVLSLLLMVSANTIGFSQSAAPQPIISARVTHVLQINGLLFKDLNKNGKLDVYEDWRRSIEERVNDLVTQMTLEEKAGLMVGPQLNAGPNGSVSEQAVYGQNPFNPGPVQMNSPATTDALLRRHIRQFINRENLPARTMATWLNAGLTTRPAGCSLMISMPAIVATADDSDVGPAETAGR